MQGHAYISLNLAGGLPPIAFEVSLKSWILSNPAVIFGLNAEESSSVNIYSHAGWGFATPSQTFGDAVIFVS